MAKIQQMLSLQRVLGLELRHSLLWQFHSWCWKLLHEIGLIQCEAEGQIGAQSAADLHESD